VVCCVVLWFGIVILFGFVCCFVVCSVVLFGFVCCFVVCSVVLFWFVVLFGCCSGGELRCIG